MKTHRSIPQLFLSLMLNRIRMTAILRLYTMQFAVPLQAKPVSESEPASVGCGRGPLPVLLRMYIHP